MSLHLSDSRHRKQKMKFIDHQKGNIMDTHWKKCPKCESDIRIPKETNRSTLCCKSCGKRVYVMSLGNGEAPSFKQKEEIQTIEMTPMDAVLSSNGVAAIQKTRLTSKKKRWGKAPPEDMSPFRTIWFNPGITIRRIIKTNPRKYVLPLSALFGVFNFTPIAFIVLGALDFSHEDPLSLFSLFTFGVLGGAVMGALYCYPMGLLISLVGRLMGGIANWEESRAAWAWASIAYIPIIILSLFSMVFRTLDQTWANGLAAGVFLLSLWITWFYCLVVIYSCIAEVHKFSGMKAFATLSAAGVISYALIEFGSRWIISCI